MPTPYAQYHISAQHPSPFPSAKNCSKTMANCRNAILSKLEQRVQIQRPRNSLIMPYEESVEEGWARCGILQWSHSNKAQS